MRVEQYQVKNNMSMDPMHDSYADEIRIENKETRKNIDNLLCFFIINLLINQKNIIKNRFIIFRV